MAATEGEIISDVEFIEIILTTNSNISICRDRSSCLHVAADADCNLISFSCRDVERTLAAHVERVFAVDTMIGSGVDGHRLAVVNDEMSIAKEVERVVEGDVAIHLIPASGKVGQCIICQCYSRCLVSTASKGRNEGNGEVDVCAVLHVVGHGECGGSTVDGQFCSNHSHLITISIPVFYAYGIATLRCKGQRNICTLLSRYTNRLSACRALVVVCHRAVARHIDHDGRWQNGELLLHRAQRCIGALEGGYYLSRAEVGVVGIGIYIVRAFGEAERTGYDERLGGDFAACVGLVGNIGNGWSDFLHNDAAVAVLNDGEVVGLAFGHVGLSLVFNMHICHALADARCVNHFDAIINGDSSYNCMTI